MLTTEQAVVILSTLATRDEAGTHYTRLHNRDVLSVYVTEDGCDLVNTYPDYWTGEDLHPVTCAACGTQDGDHATNCPQSMPGDVLIETEPR